MSELDHFWVDVVEAKDVPRPAVSRKRSRAQSHHAHPQGSAGARVENGKPDSRSHPVVAGRPVAPVRFEELLAVNDGAVREHAHGFRPLARISNVEHAIEIAGGEARIRGVIPISPCKSDAEADDEREENQSSGRSPAPVEQARTVAQQRNHRKQGKRA